MAAYSDYTNITTNMNIVYSNTTASAHPASKPKLDAETNFKVVIQELWPKKRYKYEIHFADNYDIERSWRSRIEQGYGRSSKQAENKARKHIDKLLRPYQPKPTINNYLPSIVKRLRGI